MASHLSSNAPALAAGDFLPAAATGGSIRALTPLMLAALTSPCLADIAGHAEASTEVQVYRALENEFLQSERGRRLVGNLKKSLCRGTPKMDAEEPVTSKGRHSNMTGDGLLAERCVQTFDRSCRGGLLGKQDPNEWMEVREQVGFATYVSHLARAADVPLTELQPALKALQRKTLSSIVKQLRAPEASAVGGTLFMGPGMVAPAPARHGEPALEVGRLWNDYVRGNLPARAGTSVPVFQFIPPSPNCMAAGERAYGLQSEPLGARMRIISDLDWQLCQAIGQDPWSPTCRGWSRVTTDMTYLSGTYRYEAKWGSGKVSRDTFRVDWASGDVITLR